MLSLDACSDEAQNAFAEKLGPLGFDHFSMFVVDLMHEVELGTWKHLFIHILRIIDAKDSGLLHEVDYRYAIDSILSGWCSDKFCRFRQIPTFGRDTIRKFSSNTSEMKKLCARDFEDILQVRDLCFMLDRMLTRHRIKVCHPCFRWPTGRAPQQHTLATVIFICTLAWPSKASVAYRYYVGYHGSSDDRTWPGTPRI